MRSADGRIVRGAVESDGTRILVDDGFMRLYDSSLSMGNAACWLFINENRGVDDDDAGGGASGGAAVSAGSKTGARGVPAYGCAPLKSTWALR
jgi:hypothetical protein